MTIFATFPAGLLILQSLLTVAFGRSIRTKATPERHGGPANQARSLCSTLPRSRKRCSPLKGLFLITCMTGRPMVNRCSPAVIVEHPRDGRYACSRSPRLRMRKLTCESWLQIRRTVFGPRAFRPTAVGFYTSSKSRVEQVFRFFMSLRLQAGRRFESPEKIYGAIGPVGRLTEKRSSSFPTTIQASSMSGESISIQRLEAPSTNHFRSRRLKAPGE